MDDELALYLSQRAELIISDDADLGQLRKQDRRLLSAMDRGALESPLSQREGADEALLEALETDPEQNALLLEARDRIWPGELARVQQLLIAQEGDRGAAWWLAAHYSHLPCPEDFPSAWFAQVWAARALYRRGKIKELPEPWSLWAGAQSGAVSVKETAIALWEAGDGALWEDWLPRLLVASDSDGASALVNGLAPYLTDEELIQLMGMSCQSRFLPWLASFRHDEELKEVALREVRWLSGDQQKRHQGRQCWGEDVSEAPWQQLFQSVPLGFRGRLWHWCADAVEGAANSLQGGRWCAGN
ncbi:hypothetical protein [Salicola sp. Rm-C-2C1-2]|uniref:hypothetical protein n=1 Tax=Salicola sp. Rm-C-2C1-2 TaxID=3141321 RepID=UPI0032E44910